MQILNLNNGTSLVVNDLSHLSAILNDIERRLRDDEYGLLRYGDIHEVLDICSLPVFSENEPDDVAGIYSWDDTHNLIANESYPHDGDHWLVVERDDLDDDDDDDE